MKRLYCILLSALMLVVTLAGCDLGGDPDPGKDIPGTTQAEAQSSKEDTTAANSGSGTETGANEEDIPTTGVPIGWPDNEYTKLVPTPDSGGKVLTCGEIGTLFSIELKWSMDQGLAFAKLLQDAGFGDDCAEKYETYGYIDRTVNGVNVQLMDLFGVTSLSIMKVEE